MIGPSEIETALRGLPLQDVLKQLEIEASGGSLSRERRGLIVRAMVEIVRLRLGVSYDESLRSIAAEKDQEATRERAGRMNWESKANETERRLAKCNSAYKKVKAERDALEQQLIAADRRREEVPV